VHEVRYRRVIARPEGDAVLWHETRARLFTDASGRRRVVGTLRDVTAEVEAGTRERRAHDEVRQLNEQLERRVEERTVALTSANRELESFCYSVSHDLRAPLRSIDGFSQALLEDYGAGLDDGARNYLNIVRTETQRMGHLIDDLLNLSRVTRAEMNPAVVDLAAVAREVIDAHRRRDAARQVEVTIDSDLRCAGDEGLLRIVLDNLVANAWKFTRTRPVAHIEIGRAATDHGPAFFVRDDGVGFDMRYTRKLFEPFQRLHSMLQFEGTGIGLATVKRIVHKHGGQVWADGQVDVGATFFWTLGGVEMEA
jgi:signal transduction histidine kinase